MPLEIGLLSDTHGYLHSQVQHHFANVQQIWHAGDIGNMAVLSELEQLAPVRAVYGNIDGGALRAQLQEHLYFEAEGVKILLLHIGGYPPRYNTEAKELIEKYKPHLFICGHSHIVKIMPDKERHLLHINPGACGKQGWHKVQTLVRLRLESGKVSSCSLIELDKE